MSGSVNLVNTCSCKAKEPRGEPTTSVLNQYNL